MEEDAQQGRVARAAFQVGVGSQRGQCLAAGWGDGVFLARAGLAVGLLPPLRGRARRRRAGPRPGDPGGGGRAAGRPRAQRPADRAHVPGYS
jgi:hypothetical protein